MRVRHFLLLTALLGIAQADPLPRGLVQRDGVITMQPIPDTDQAPAGLQDRDAERRPGTARVLSAADHEIFTKAFDAADRGDWQAALAFAGRGQNAMARKLVQWRYLLDKYSNAPFEQIDAFLKSNPDWPREGVLQVRAEEALDPAMPPQAVIAWFAGRNPISATGEIRLGEAYVATGKLAAGGWLIREGWINGNFDPAQELAIVQKDGAYITPEADKRRLDNLIWGDMTTAAKREMARVDDATQRLARARLALHAHPEDYRRIIASLPADLASSPWLMFDRAQAARLAGDNDEAEDLLLRAPTRDLLKLHPVPVWREISIDARQALQDGKPKTAYRLVDDTGLKSGDQFADAQFLAGWIALRFLKDPQAALPHFQRLAEKVSRPISVARAHYWLGRTYEDMNDPAKAWAEYRTAAKASDTYYGQLAAARIHADPVLNLRPSIIDDLPSRLEFDHDDLVGAMKVLADLGSQDILRTFALRYEELHPAPGSVKLLAQWLSDVGFRDIALRVAKVAGYDGLVMPSYAFPVIPVPTYKGPGVAPEAALVLAIIRQETEFDADSVSHAGARGIMQVMPSGARKNARLAGLPYRPRALTTDVGYNMQLGMTEFSGYLSDWNNSLVLSAAAYNAGDTNARRWVAAFGDPRSPNVDPIDWVEEIPFGETRNYVQRVLENLEVYRARIAGHAVPLRILADLYAPSQPPTKILAYTPPPAPVVKPATLPIPAPNPASGETATESR